jgi:hypothetical protein
LSHLTDVEKIDTNKMTVWCRLPTIFSRRFALRTAGLLALCVALTTTLLFADASRALTGVNKTIAFQGRLQYASGGVVADGNYNIQFKIYQDGAGTAAGNPGGTLKWTESYVNNGGTSGVQVKNGYLSVNLGSVNAFGTSVDWNQDTLWLSMNIAGSAAACTTFGTAPCAADGEMLPMQRMTAVPQALNSNAVGGKTADNLVQLAQGVQTDASTNTSSIFINKTGTGNLLQLQNTATDVFTIGNAGDLTLGSNANKTISVGTSGATTPGRSLTVSGGGGGSGAGSNGGDLLLQGGAGGGTNSSGGGVVIDAGVSNGSGTLGSISIGTANAANIQIGSTGGLAGGTTQTITIGGLNYAGSTQNIVIGSGNGAQGGSTTIQSKNNTTITTDGVSRATFDTSGNLFLGNGASSVTPAAFAIQGTSSSASGVTGGALTVQGGGTTTGNANGGNLILKGGTGSGTGSNGLVVLTTPTFQSSGSVQTCSGSATTLGITQTSVDSNSVVPVASTSSASCVISLPNPSITTAGRIVYVTADGTSTANFSLSVNGGGTGNVVMMRAYTTATMVWNGSAWTVAGASSSTTLQAAYDNTIQNSGGAELIVSKTSNTNGLTIRDSTGANTVNGALLNVQSGSASNLFSVNSTVTEYASNPGAESYSGATNTFPSSTWSAQGTGASISRNITTNNNTIATGQASTSVTTTGSTDSGVKNQIVDPTNSTPTAIALAANNHYNVSFSARLPTGASIFNDLKVDYSRDGTTTGLTNCASSQTVAINVWTKVNCSFTAPASGITTGNAIFIRQTAGASRVFYVDNISVTIAADYSLATDGGVNDAGNFATNWTTTNGGNATVTQTSLDSNTASSSAKVDVTTGAQYAGGKNKLSINPITNTRYRVTAYAKQTAGAAFSDFTIRYTRDGGTNYVNCEDYNTQAVPGAWTKISCYINTDGTGASNPQIAFTEGSSAVRTFLIDDFSMTLATPSTPNVQIGSGSNGGPTTLLTLDRAASAPIAGDNDALLGSMYYDTTIGKLQCYEADGWGSCGSAPDNIITISPEYSNAVMHGTGVGTMTSDICSDTLDINDGSSSQPTICGTNETRNFYKWTSPQASAQAYSIYVTYQLPSTLKAFTSGTTSLQAKTDSSNASVVYQIYRSNSSGLNPCGSSISVATGNVAWQTGLATAGSDPFTCSFSAGDSIVFKVTMSSASNANAYIGNLGFTFSNK